MISKRSKVITIEGTELPEGTIIDVKDSHKHLWVLQANGNLEEATWRSVTIEYLQKVRQVLKNQLNGRSDALR